MRPGTLLRWHALRRILIAEVNDNSVILDIGGYDGFISHNLMKFVSNLNITLVDLDKSGLQLAKEKRFNTLCASSLELPIENNQVDIVLCLDLLEHVTEDSKVTGEISRVLKKNGKVILTTPMKNGVSFPFLDKKKIEEINKNWGHIRRGYNLEQIRILFQNNNLTIKKTSEYFNFFTRLVYRFTMLSKPSPLRWFVYKSIIKLEPFIKCGTEEHIIIGEKL